MYSLHTDPTHDLGTLMCRTIDLLTTVIDDAVTGSAEMVPQAPDGEATFDYYTFACSLLDCQ